MAAEAGLATSTVQVVFDLPLDRVFTYALAPGQNPQPGCRVEAPFGKRRLEGLTLSLGVRPEGDFALKPLHRVVDEVSLWGPHTLELGRWVAQNSLCSLGEALHAMLPSGRREKPLEELPEPSPADHDLQLSEEQAAAVQALAVDPGPVFYLEGQTGSGKTEVFLQAAHRVLSAGGSVLYLVPEIALTHQLVRTLRQRFGSLALLHSSLSPSQRLQEWRRVLSGEARMVLGARSALFAPVSRLGLIILDEEHEGSYKSGSVPRFHARQAAQALAQMTGAKVLMGSATPSLEAWHLLEEGRLKRLRLSRRLAGGAPPQVTLVDARGQSGLFGPLLKERLQAVWREGRQSVLFLNRRGFSYFFHCRSCGYEQTCPQCSVPMTYHKSRGLLLCHYCGSHAAPLSVCPRCRSLDIGWAGLGTEGVEEEIQALVPGARIGRLDADTAAEKGQGALLRSFEKGELDILVGTQMVAKGLNFRGLKLVGLVNADTGLSLPDFRAAERTFALIRQVAGRAGRFFPDGEVIVQTWRPDHPVLRFAAAGDDGAFYRWERENRRLLGFPPFNRLGRVVVRSRRPDLAETAAQELRRLCDRLPEGVEWLGPAECALSLVNGQYRWQILARSPRARTVQEALAWLKAAWEPRSGVSAEWDLDPVALL